MPLPAPASSGGPRCPREREAVRSAGVLNDALLRRRIDRRSFAATGASPLLRRVRSVCGYDETLFAA
jgi:hypothetical protein